MTGEAGSGDGDGDLQKFVVHVTDASKVKGNTINIPLYAGYGGAGVQGDGTRTGNEEKSQMTTMQLVIGRFFHAIGDTGVSRDETMLGSGYDERVRKGLKYIHARKRSDDIFRRLIKRSSGRNLMFPPAATALTRATLKTANVLDTPTFITVKNRLSSNGAEPMALGTVKDSGGTRPEMYMLMATQFALSDVEQDPTYTDALQTADDRGVKNAIFAGDFKPWRSLGIYNWKLKDHGNWGPIGCFLAPRAVLVGTHTTKATAQAGTFQALTNSSFLAFGTISASGTGANYSQYFSNAPWTYHNGLTEAADTTTDRYVLIVDANGGGSGVFKYRINDGNTINLHSSGAVVTVAGATQTTFTAGSLVVECNELGVPFGRSLGFGAKGVVTGLGSIDGTVSSIGKRQEQIQEYGNYRGIGAENTWGCEVVERPDGTYPGFVFIEHALTVPGAPVIA